MKGLKGIALGFLWSALLMVIGHNIVPHHHHEFCFAEHNTLPLSNCETHYGAPDEHCLECGGLSPWDTGGDEKECLIEIVIPAGKQLLTALLQPSYFYVSPGESPYEQNQTLSPEIPPNTPLVGVQLRGPPFA